MKSKSSLYAQMDKTWKVEIALAEALAADAGDVCMKDHIMKCLPTAAREISLNQSHESLKALGEGDFYRYSAKSAQAKLDMTIELVGEIVRGREPRWQLLQGSPFMREVSLQLPFFARTFAPGASDDAELVVLVGKPALHHMLAGLKEKHAAKQTIDLSMLESFHVFSWLLEPADKEFVEKMTQDLVSAIQAPGPKKRAARDEPSNKQAKSKKAKGSATSSKVMDLFA